MPIMVTLSVDLRVPVPTVGGICLVLTTQNTLSIVVGHNSNWLIPTLDKNHTVASSEYYWWSTGSDGQLLFIFPTRVSLTTITLHYYSDSIRGLPRLRFYAVVDAFDVWDAPTTNFPHVEVAAVQPGGEPAGHRSVSINVNFNTKKVLM